MIIVDLFCKKCNKEHIDVFVDIKLPMPMCPDCDIELTRMVAKRVSFELKYDNRKDICGWSNDGYATSRYWSEIKKQKSEGKKVEEPKNDKQAKWL